MKAELIVAKEAAVLLRRDPVKYFRGVTGMYLMSIKGLEMGSTFRSAYYFVRHVDDVLDGDRQVSCDPLAYVQDLRHQVETGNYRNGMNIGILAQNAVVNLERRAKPGDNPRADFLDAIDEIIFDYHRSQERRLLTAKELEAYYRRAFSPVVNLTLIGINSSLRSKDVPVMTYGQGRVYSARDLNDDWPRGTLNVPGEVLEQANLTPNSTLETIATSAHVRRWFQTILSKTRPELKELQKQLMGSSEGLTSVICGGLISPILRFIDKYEGVKHED